MNHSDAWPFKKTAAFHSVRQISLIALPPLRFPDYGVVKVTNLVAWTCTFVKIISKTYSITGLTLSGPGGGGIRPPKGFPP